MSLFLLLKCLLSILWIFYPHKMKSSLCHWNKTLTTKCVFFRESFNADPPLTLFVQSSDKFLAERSYSLKIQGDDESTFLKHPDRLAFIVFTKKKFHPFVYLRKYVTLLKHPAHKVGILHFNSEWPKNWLVQEKCSAKVFFVQFDWKKIIAGENSWLFIMHFLSLTHFHIIIFRSRDLSYCEIYTQHQGDTYSIHSLKEHFMFICLFAYRWLLKMEIFLNNPSICQKWDQKH